jgi:hypothetical protein
LRGIDGELHGGSVDGDNFVLLDWGVGGIGLGIDELAIQRVVQIGGRNVVSHSKNASVVTGIDIGDGPVVSSGVSSGRGGISKVILSSPRSLDAIGGSLSVGIDLDPFVSSSFARSLLVLLGGSSNGSSAFVSRLNVLRFLLVEIAILGGGGEDGNINPWGRMPVGIVVSLFGAFESMSVSIVVLSSENGSSSTLVEVSFLSSIGNEETKVSFSGIASLVVGQSLMLTESVLVSSGCSDRLGGGIDSGGGSSVSDVVLSIGGLVGSTHILDHQVAEQSRVAATMLVRPFDSEERTLIKRHFGTLAVTSLGVVLRVEQSIGIVSIGIVFSQPIVGSSNVLHVKITKAGGHTT